MNLTTTRITSTILVLIVGLAACASAPRGAAAPVRVLTYNIHAGKDVAQQHNLERIAQVIRDAQADIVLLQEVDRGTQRSGREDQLATLAMLTSMHSAYGKTIDFQGGEYGIAMLSRYPLDSTRVVPLEVQLPAEPAATYEARVALHAIARTSAGSLHVINTHLDAGGATALRQQQVISLLAYVARNVPRDAVLIVGGDLNARPETREIGALTLSFADAWVVCGDGGPGHSFSAATPDRRIDYVLMRGAGCSSARVLEAQPSDHRAVLVHVTPRRR